MELSLTYVQLIRQDRISYLKTALADHHLLLFRQ